MSSGGPFNDLLARPGEMGARILLSELPLELRIADLCPGCGMHMLEPSERVAWLREGGVVHCKGCGIEKSR